MESSSTLRFHQARYFETLEPFLKTPCGLGLSKAFQTGEEYGLVAYFHFLVETAFLGEITDIHHIVLAQRMTVEGHQTGIWRRDMVYYSDECGLAGAVRAQKTVDRALRHRERDRIERLMAGIGLAHVIYR